MLRRYLKAHSFATIAAALIVAATAGVSSAQDLASLNCSGRYLAGTECARSGSQFCVVISGIYRNTTAAPVSKVRVAAISRPGQVLFTGTADVGSVPPSSSAIFEVYLPAAVQQIVGQQQAENVVASCLTQPAN